MGLNDNDNDNDNDITEVATRWHRDHCPKGGARVGEGCEPEQIHKWSADIIHYYLAQTPASLARSAPPGYHGQHGWEGDPLSQALHQILT